MIFRSATSIALFSGILGLIGPINYIISDGLYIISTEYLLYYVFDVIITSFAVGFFVASASTYFNIKGYLINLFDSRFFVLGVKLVVLACLLVVVLRLRELYDIIFNIGREGLVFDFGLSLSVSFAVSLSVIVLSLQFVGLRLRKTWKFIPLFVFVLGSLVQLSRSEILFFIYFFLMFYALVHKYYCISLFRSISIIIALMLLSLFVLAINILQGRAEDVFSAYQNSSSAFIDYRSGALYLGYYISNISYSVDFLLYPFFGFVSEKVMASLFALDYYLSVNGSDSFYQFIRFGSEPNHVGNVLYPWPSFFYYQFGYLGLLIKPLFAISIIYFSARFKLYFLSVYICYSVFFLAPLKHPLLNADSTYQAIFFILFDLFALFSAKKNENICH